jgi:solute carrier family 25 aspartate/glutamate transporter 12/13
MDASKLFNQWAVEKGSEKILSKENFATAINSFRPCDISPNEAEILFRSVSTGKPDMTIEPFKNFIVNLESTDVEYRILGQLVGYSGVQSSVPLEQLKSSLINHSNFTSAELNSNSVKLFWKSVGSSVNFSLFVELIDILRDERVYTFFHSQDKNNSGFISGNDALDFFQPYYAFKNSTIRNNFLSSFNMITFPEFRSLNKALKKTYLLNTLTQEASKLGGALDVTSLFKANSSISVKSEGFSRLELEILMRLIGDTTSIAFQRLFDPLLDSKPKEIVQLSALMETAKSIYNFTLGSIAGATGAFAVYPIGKYTYF